MWNRLINAKNLLLLLSGVPAFLFAYLGHFSRLLVDDYCVFHVGRTLNAWQGLLYHYNLHTGTYSRTLLHFVLAPIDVLATSFMPLVIVVLSIIGLYWILHRVVASFLRGRTHKLAFWILSVLITATSINAFISPEPFYWYNASVGYALPSALFILYVAFLIEMACKDWSTTRMYLGLAASAAIAFALGGASEMFVVFQFTFLTLAIVFIVIFLASPVRRRFFFLFLSGWLATTAGLFIQLSSPGARNRIAGIEAGPIEPIRAVPELLSRSLNSTVQYLAHQEAFAGFMLLFGLGLIATLILYRPAPMRTQAKPITLASTPLWLCLFIQLLFLPILWTHVSDLPQVAGRFSFAFTTVVATNVGSIAVILSLLTWRKRIIWLLRSYRNGMMMYTLSLLLFVTLLFAMTQVRSIHYKAATYLYFSALTYLGVLGWQLSHFIADRRASRFALLATVSYLVPFAATAVLVGVALYGRGSITERMLAPIAYLQVIPGLIWGSYLAFQIQRWRLRSEASRRWITVIGATGLLLASTVAAGIVFGQARQISDFAVFARDWDARHQQLLQLRESGIREVEVQTLEFDLSRFLLGGNLSVGVEKRCAQRYYNMETISVVQS